MNKKLTAIYNNNKLIIWAAVISVLLTIGVLAMVKDEVTRFTLIMPVFAGFILFSILVTPDEELEDEIMEEKAEKPEADTAKKSSAKDRSALGRKKSSR